MNIIKGDLIKMTMAGHFDVIIHGANCFNTMGSGIAKQIREKFPEAYAADCATVAGDRSKLGTYTEAHYNFLVVVNAYTQYDFNKRGESKDLFEYDSFRAILDSLAAKYVGSSFGLPMIGCGLAGGDKTRIIKIIEDFATIVESKNGSVTLVQYD